MKLAVLVSSGGAAFEQVARIAQPDGVDFTVITDRGCGAEADAGRVNAQHIRIEERDRKLFSAKVAATLQDLRVNNILLFFDRLVSSELFDRVDTFNIHPAVLPAFKGLKGVEDAYEAKVRLLGCSLHRVDQSVDGGELVSDRLRCRSTVAAFALAEASIPHEGLLRIGLGEPCGPLRGAPHASQRVTRPSRGVDGFLQGVAGTRRRNGRLEKIGEGADRCELSGRLQDLLPS